MSLRKKTIHGLGWAFTSQTLDKFRTSLLVSDAITTTIWNTLGKGLGLIVPFFIAAWFGLSAETDVFFFVYGIILYVTGIASTSLESNIVPFIAKIREDKQNEVVVFINRLLSLTLIATVIVTIVFIILATPVMRLVTHFPRNSQNLLFQLLLEISPLLSLLVLSSILAGILNAYFKFWLPAFSPGIRATICLIIIFLLKNKIGIHSVTLGYISGELLRIAVFLYVLAKHKIIHFRFNFKIDAELTRFFKTMSFQIISMFVIGLNPVVDKAMASWLSVGSVSALQYSDRLYLIPVTFIISGIMVVLLSRWSDKYYQHRSIMLLRRDTFKAMGIMATISIVTTLVFALFSKDLVRFAYARGKFPMELLCLVRSTFLCYLIGLTFYLVGQVIVRAQLVLNNTKTLMKAAFISCFSNVMLNFIFMQYFGVNGIAFSTSVTGAITFLYLYQSFYKLSKERIV